MVPQDHLALLDPLAVQPDLLGQPAQLARRARREPLADRRVQLAPRVMRVL